MSSVRVLKQSRFFAKALACVGFVLALSSLAAAEEAAPAAPAPRKNAINFHVPDAIFNSYFLNFEHLFGSRHGLVVEGGYIGSFTYPSVNIGGKSAKWQTSQGYTVGVQYRYHFSEQLESPFIGAFIKYGSVSGTILSAKGSGVLFDSTVGQPQIGFASSYQIIGLNIGHRFIWGWGLTVTLRIGAGGIFGYYNYGTEDFEKNRDAFSAVFNTFLRFDAEVSIGYAF